MLIGLAGYARTGKDTVAEYLVQNYGFTRMAFADPMKEALYRLDPNISMNGLSGMSLAYAVDKMGWEQLKSMSPDIRPLLQRMGTEVGRNMFGEDFWVDYAIGQSWKHENVVFSDVRFRNEANAISKNWGYNIKVTRAGVGPANDHISERDLDEFKQFHNFIENDGTIEEMHAQVDLIMAELNG